MVGVLMIDRRTIWLGAVTACVAGNFVTSPAWALNDAWSAHEPEYVLFPGDELDIALPAAPELNRTAVVAPDGRLSLPLVGHVAASDLTLTQLEARISQAYANHLVRPAVEVTLRRAAPAKIWIDGQVRTPGAFDLPGEAIDARQAILLAGGATVGARSRRAVLIRRGSDGLPRSTVVDLRSRSQNAPRVYRGDIIFVPRNAVGEIAAYMSQIRDALPVGFSYALNGRWN